MLKSAALFVALMLLALAGCGDAAANRLIGVWKYDFAKAAAGEAGKRMGENGPGNAVAALGVAQALGIKMEMTLDFKSNQTVNIATSGIPFPFAGDMTWRTVENADDKLTIEITNPQDKRSSRVQITFIDRDHLRFSPPDSDAKSMEFERVKEK
jgi:hypothetical protein